MSPCLMKDLTIVARFTSLEIINNDTTTTDAGLKLKNIDAKATKPAFNSDNLNNLKQKLILIKKEEKEIENSIHTIKEKILEKRYPVKYVIVHSVVLGILAIMQILVQIIMIIKKSSIYEIGVGI